ncbi:hypothetical protein [Microbaculum sp. FT89]|uniref:hypothetical protein n=1 Tax=Microbaculum sp. FT89 TaxID=3447298 RepID=UPI003F532D08
MILSHLSTRHRATAAKSISKLAGMAFGFMLPLVAGIGQPSAQDVTFADFPVVIYCEFEGVHRAYYFARVGPDGHAIYISPDRQAGTITVDGVAVRIGGERSGSCAGKTLEDLRGSGQAFDIAR